MNHDTIVGRLKQLRGRCKIQWANFIGDYPGRIAGRRIEAAGRLQMARGAVLRPRPLTGARGPTRPGSRGR